MNALQDKPAAKSIESITLESLDQSLEGLETLRRLSMHCGDVLIADHNQGLQHFGRFAMALQTFYVFENDIVSLFNLPTNEIRDNRGDLKTEETRLSEAMEQMVTLADKQDWANLSSLLRVDFPLVIDRFEDLLPALRNRIENDYVIHSN
jgi:hypothetical protein